MSRPGEHDASSGGADGIRSDTVHMLSQRLQRRIARADLPPAVVVGTGITGLSLARSLARHGVVVIGIDHHRKRYTSYSGAFHLMLISKDRYYGEGLVHTLDRLAEILPRKAVLLLSMDETVKLVSAYGQSLKQSYHFEFPSPETVDLLMSKSAFARLAERRGWLVPMTRTFSTPGELEQALPKLIFPVILKPQQKNQSFRRNSPRKAFRCADPDELLATYRFMARWEPEGIVQEWIPGGDDQVYFSFHYLDSHLREVCSYQGRKIRQYQPECGSTSSAIGVRADELGDSSRQILTETSCIGFCSVEYKRSSETGRFYVTEPTVGRVNLQVGVAAANGVDIPSRAYFHLIGREYPSRERVKFDTKWIILSSDLKSASYWVRQSRYTWFDYLRSMRGPKVFAIWRLSDYKMFTGFLRVWLSWPLRRAKSLVGRGARSDGEAGRPGPGTDQSSIGDEGSAVTENI